MGIHHETSEKLRHIAHLFSVYVRPEVRGMGLARKLMENALLTARPAFLVKLSVNANNESAQALYRSMGFTVWARDEKAMCVEGLFQDELLMRLEL